MRVLMISLDNSLLGDPHGSTIERHRDYARASGEMAIVVYNPAAHRKTPQRLSDELTVYPANTRPVLFPWAGFRTAAWLQRAAPFDVVTTQDPFATGFVGLLLKWRFGLPLNVQNHSSFFHNRDWLAERPLRNRLLHWLGAFVLRRADTVRVLTQAEKQKYLGLGIPAERVIVVPSVARVDLFGEPPTPQQIAALRQQLDLAPDAPVVLWVGMPGPVKHLELLLEAFAQVQHALPAARLVLVGDFSRRPDLVARADPASVRFAGKVANEDLPPYFTLAAVYAHSSRYEGIPRVFIEALSAGTPVVTTRYLGVEDVVRDGETGLVVEPQPESLAAGILALLRDPARARQLGAAGQRDMRARFDYQQLVREVAAFYRATRDLRR